LEPLVEELKAEKLQVEQERDAQEAQVATLKGHVASLQAQIEQLNAEVRSPALNLHFLNLAVLAISYSCIKFYVRIGACVVFNRLFWTERSGAGDDD
jgi:uncharacterized protein HemX